VLTTQKLFYTVMLMYDSKKINARDMDWFRKVAFNQS